MLQVKLGIPNMALASILMKGGLKGDLKGGLKGNLKDKTSLALNYLTYLQLEQLRKQLVALGE
mgnify:CR=1 FL=1|jgi:hypothetical protein